MSNFSITIKDNETGNIEEVQAATFLGATLNYEFDEKSQEGLRVSVEQKGNITNYTFILNAILIKAYESSDNLEKIDSEILAALSMARSHELLKRNSI